MHAHVEPYPEQPAVHLIHTDSLRDHCWIPNRRIARAGVRVLEGPLLLLSRVGKPDLRKLVLISTPESVCLSDCVIALQGDLETLKRLDAGLRFYWQELKSAYGGSCARHLTLEQLESFLVAWAEAMTELSVAYPLERQQPARGRARVHTEGDWVDQGNLAR